MKMNMSVFKKGKPVYWVVGGVVIFVVFYLMFNKGASGSSGVTVQNTGPSDAAVAASTSLAAMQTQASAGVAIATLQANSQTSQTQAAADVAKYQASLDATTAAQYYQTQKEITAINGEYTFDTAKVAAETVQFQYATNANVLTHQMDTNAAMFVEATKASVAQTALSQVSGLDYRTRSQALVATLGLLNGKQVVWTPAQGNNVSVSG